MKSWIKRLIILVLVVTILLPVGLTVIYRFVPPPITYLMVQRLFEGRGLNKEWRPLDRISPSLVQAVVASEDARFCSHDGFDFEAIEKALANNARRPAAIRGGSTISQQTAKNVFLWPARSWVRKGLEAYFTVLIEVLWDKPRIMEVYLNVAEWGPGTYGAEAAAQRYFKTSAARLTRTQSARLAAVLPNPIKFNAGRPGPRTARKSRVIRSRAATVRQSDLADCVLG
jgi:monofunctional biosynthetic peptidoglycan transglycosylase